MNPKILGYNKRRQNENNRRVVQVPRRVTQCGSCIIRQKISETKYACTMGQDMESSKICNYCRDKIEGMGDTQSPDLMGDWHGINE